MKPRLIPRLFRYRAAEAEARTLREPRHVTVPRSDSTAGGRLQSLWRKRPRAAQQELWGACLGGQCLGLSSQAACRRRCAWC